MEKYYTLLGYLMLALATFVGLTLLISINFACGFTLVAGIFALGFFLLDKGSSV